MANRLVNIKIVLCHPLPGLTNITFDIENNIELLRYAIKFAESSDVWITEFSRVYYKMLSNGSNNLRRIER